MRGNVVCVLHHRCVDGVRAGLSVWLSFGCVICGKRSPVGTGCIFFVVFVVFLWCEKVLWLGGAVAWLCCVCGGVSKRSVGEGFCTQCWGRVL